MLKTLTAIGIGAAIAFAPLAALAQTDTTTAPAATAPAASDTTTPPAKNAMKMKKHAKKHTAKKHMAKKAKKPAEESAPAAPADEPKN